MRKLLVSIVLGLTLALGGCAEQFSLFKKETIEEMSPVEKVQAGVTQLKALVTVVNRGAIADRKVGVYNDSEWASLKSALNVVDKHIKDSEVYIEIGDFITAQHKKDLAETAFAFIKAELVKRKE